MLDDREARHALRTVAMGSHSPWRAAGSALDRATDEEAARDALVACLERYDATRGVVFAVDAAPCMRGAVRRAWLRSRIRHACRGNSRGCHAPPRAAVLRPASFAMPARVEHAERVPRLAVAAQHVVTMGLGRETAAASARAVGRTSAWGVTQQVARWRREAVPEGRCCFTGTGSGQTPWTFLPASDGGLQYLISLRETPGPEAGRYGHVPRQCESHCEGPEHGRRDGLCPLHRP